MDNIGTFWRPLILSGAASWGIVCAGSSDALAQTAPPDTSSVAEIVVTAQKTPTTQQKTPAAITTIVGGDLVRQGISDLDAVGQLAPSLNIEPVRTQTNIFLRGIGQTLTSPNSDPAIAVNINGAYVPNEMTGVSFFDIDRLEVLPGPQGTLYGRNAVGGVINIITRRPGAQYSEEGFLEYGNYNRVQAFAAVDAPLTDTFAIRGALNFIQHDGYFTNGMDDQDSVGGRLTAVWRPDPKTTVTAIAGYSHDGGVGSTAQNVPSPSSNVWQLNFNPKAAGYSIDNKATQTSIEVDRKINDAVNFTYIGGYNHISIFQDGAFWAGPPPTPLMVNQGTTEYSQEARFNANWDRWQVLAGAYYFYTRSLYTASLYPVPVVYIVDGPFLSQSKGEAVFGQTTYALTQALRLTGGLRYSYTQKSLNGQNTEAVLGTQVSDDKYNGSDEKYYVDWKAGLEYDLRPRSMLYGSVSTGFSPGGFSTASITPTTNQAAPYLPMEVTAYTVGIKNRFFSNRLTANLEIYDYDYKNYQVSQRNPFTGQNQVYNAAQAQVYGGQLDLTARLSPVDQISLDPAYLSAKAKTLVTPAGNFDGYALPYSPDWTVNSSYQHKFMLNGGSEIIAFVDSQYASSQWAFYTHAAGGLISSNTRTNLDLSYHFPLSHWVVALWVRNLENSIVYTSGISGTTPGPASFFIAPPRTFGLRVSFKS